MYNMCMSHEFGNIDLWTRDKLIKVRQYLDAYLVALKNKNFDLEYIDAFAGTGYVTRHAKVPCRLLFDEEQTVSLREFIDGSARLALQTDPSFNKYTFIEKHAKRFGELQKLKNEFPQLADRIEIINSDANEYVRARCGYDWLRTYRRAVMFLDPYGTQLSWTTITAIANTQAIDTWILFPLGTVNRLLNRNGRIIEGRRRRLNSLFGESEWFDRFYQRREDTLSFVSDSDMSYTKLASFDVIVDYFLDRLRTCFSAVAPNPLVLKNSANSPIFLLCFAAGNPRGAPVAVRIAEHILGKK